MKNLTHLPSIAAFIAFLGLIMGAQVGHPWIGMCVGILVVVVLVEVFWMRK